MREAYAQALESAGRDFRVLRFSEIASVQKPSEKTSTALVLINATTQSFVGEHLFQVFQNIETRLPGIPIALISETFDADEIRAAIDTGFRGCLPIALELEDVVEALRLIAAGGTFVPAETVLADLQDSAPEMSPLQPCRPSEIPPEAPSDDSAVDKTALMIALENLTPREQAVLEELCQGKSNKLIARALTVSEATVKVHVRHIMRKLGVQNRTQVAMQISRLKE
jgi:DNA-binding NarL/FixJ family response regulator